MNIVKLFHLNALVVLFFIFSTLFFRWADIPSSFFLLDFFAKSFVVMTLLFSFYLYKRFSPAKILVSTVLVIYSCGWLYLAKTESITLFNYAVGGVNSNSMYPTLRIGDYLVYKKKDKNEKVKRGSIVSTTVVNQSGNGFVDIDKRVAGVPGDLIFVCDYEVFINSVSFYDNHKELANCLHVEKFKLSENSYYLLGDNKFSSYDSRFFGSIELLNIDYLIVYKVAPNSEVTYF